MKSKLNKKKLNWYQNEIKSTIKFRKITESMNMVNSDPFNNCNPFKKETREPKYLNNHKLFRVDSHVKLPKNVLE